MPRRSWQNPVTLLVLMSVAMPVAFNAWSALLNNFVVERAAFWQLVIERLDVVFQRPPDEILDLANGVTDPRWLVGVDVRGYWVATHAQSPLDPFVITAAARVGVRFDLH